MKKSRAIFKSDLSRILSYVSAFTVSGDGPIIAVINIWFNITFQMPRTCKTVVMFSIVTTHLLYDH